MEEFLTG